MKYLNSHFEILSYSDSRYDKLTVEVQFRGEPLLQINQDKGNDNLEVEMFRNGSDLKFSLNDFMDVLKISKKFL